MSALQSTLSIDQRDGRVLPGRSNIVRSVDLTCFIHDVLKVRTQVDVIFTNFSKAFDSVDHNFLICILDKLGEGFPSVMDLILPGREMIIC